MTWLLAESDDISPDLLRPLLSSVKKENQAILILWIYFDLFMLCSFSMISETLIFFCYQAVSPISCKLGEEVLKSCSAKIQPHLSKAVKLMRLNFDDYSELISSLCQDEPNGGILVIFCVYVF